jgi:hypothetical protein
MADVNQLSALKASMGKSSSEFQSRQDNRNTIVSLKVFLIICILIIIIINYFNIFIKLNRIKII